MLFGHAKISSLHVLERMRRLLGSLHLNVIITYITTIEGALTIHGNLSIFADAVYLINVTQKNGFIISYLQQSFNYITNAKYQINLSYRTSSNIYLRYYGKRCNFYGFQVILNNT